MTLWLDVLRADIVCAFRGLRRARGIPVTAVVVLGAAIGLNAALFTIIAGIVWRPWSGVSDPDTLVRVYAQDPSGQVTGLSIADARMLAGQVTSLQGVSSMRGDAVEIENVGSARALMISGNLLDLLGVAPAFGRRILGASTSDTSTPPRTSARTRAATGTSPCSTLITPAPMPTPRTPGNERRTSKAPSRGDTRMRSPDGARSSATCTFARS